MGYPAAVAVFIGTALWFWLARDSFIARRPLHGGHPPLRLHRRDRCLERVRPQGASDQPGQDNPSLRNRYSFLAAAMVIAVVLMGSYKIAFGWDYGILFIEATVIAPVRGLLGDPDP